MDAIDISQYPAPDVLEALNYESTLSAIIEEFVAQFPADEAVAAASSIPSQDNIRRVIEIEGNLVRKTLEAFAYHAITLRARVNDAARSTMIAYAAGPDLENLAAFYGITRKVIDPGDATAIPIVPPTYESDEDLRERILLALDGQSTAGPRSSYKFHALSADGSVKDVAVDSPAPGDVRVTILAHEGDGTAPQALQDTVLAALNAEDVRPLTDFVIVQSATVLNFAVAADLTLYPGTDEASTTAAAQAAVQAYVTDVQRIGYDVTISGLHRALHQPGVQSVSLTTPTASITTGPTQAPYCTGITLNVVGTDV